MPTARTLLKDDRRAPQLEIECPDFIDDALQSALLAQVRKRHAHRLGSALGLTVSARAGSDAVCAIAVVRRGRRHHEIFVFGRGTTSTSAPLEGPLAPALDHLDGLVASLLADDDSYLPLDWTGLERDDDGGVLFVRGEVRDYEAEAEAARLLGEAMTPRALDRPVLSSGPDGDPIIH